MIGRLADPHEDRMPWVEVTDNATFPNSPVRLT